MIVAATSRVSAAQWILLTAHGLLIATSSAPVCAQSAQRPVTLIKDGVAQLPVISGSVQEPVAELRHYLRQMTGVAFEGGLAEQGKAGIYVGLVSDFPSALARMA